MKTFVPSPVPWCFLALAAASLLVGHVGAADAAVPTTIMVHGAIHSGGGGAAPDGNYTIAFSLYDGKGAAKAAWTEGVAVAVSKGRFAHAMGSAQKMPTTLLASLKAPWLGVKVGADPELPRIRIHSVLFARHAAVAATVACNGCVDSAQLAPAAVKPGQVGFSYAAAVTKGGVALAAKKLDCSGCVTTKHMKFDGDIDLGGSALKAGKVTASDIVAKTVAASKFVGDGSALTGIKTAAGKCAAGAVMTGIDGNGKPICSKTAGKLPPDGLDDVSNGALTNEFTEIAASQKALAIKDNDPTGTSSTITFPDVGNAKTLSVRVALANSDISKLTVTVFDPANKPHVLFAGGKKGKSLKGLWPTPDKVIKGDLGAWIGNNPKGSWRLLVVDKGFKNNKTDGAVSAWSVEVGVIAAKRVASKGLLQTHGGLQLQQAAKHPVACDASGKAYVYYNTSDDTIYVCNGAAWFPIGVASQLGAKERPAVSCKAIKNEGVATKNGWYWLDTDGLGPSQPVRAYCDLNTHGGGWTQVVACRPGDNCVAGGAFLYGVNWLDKDRGTAGDNASYNSAASLKDIVNKAGTFMVVVETGPAHRGTVRYVLNNDTRRWFNNSGYYQSGNLNVAVTDTTGTSYTFTGRICFQPGSYKIRSLKGSNGIVFLGRKSSAPNGGANKDCDYGPWASQMLIRDNAKGITATWGTSPVNTWNKQKYTHRILVR